MLCVSSLMLFSFLRMMNDSVALFGWHMLRTGTQGPDDFEVSSDTVHCEQCMLFSEVEKSVTHSRAS